MNIKTLQIELLESRKSLTPLSGNYYSHFCKLTLAKQKIVLSVLPAPKQSLITWNRKYSLAINF